MNFDKFEIHASPFITTRQSCECGSKLYTVSQGWLAECFYCKKCNNVYVLKMVKMNRKKVSKEFIEQCKKETIDKK